MMKKKGRIALYIGGLFLYVGDAYNSLKFYREALKYLPECSDDYIRVIYNMGEVQKRIGNLEDAKEKFESCYSRAVRMGNVKLEVYSAENIAEMHVINGNFEEAREWLMKALKSSEKLEEERGKLIVKLAYAIMNDNEEDIEKISKRFKSMGLEHDMADIYYYYSDLASPKLRDKLLKEASFIFSDLGDGRMLSKVLNKLQD